MVTAIPAVDRRVASLRGHAYAILKQAILDGRLKPGSALVEDQLCAELQISRTPLREALGRLEQDGLVNTTPYKGTAVTPITETDLRDLFQVRETLELLSLKLAWARLTTADLERLAETFERVRQPIQSQGDVEQHRLTDWALHGLLVERSENTLLARTLQALHERVVRCQLGEVMGAERAVRHRQASYDEHVRILQALIARDAAGAKRAMRGHVREASERLMEGVRRMKEGQPPAR